MSYWSVRHPEQMMEIASLPPREQNAALRAAMAGYSDWERDNWRELEQERRELAEVDRPEEEDPVEYMDRWRPVEERWDQ